MDHWLIDLIKESKLDKQFLKEFEGLDLEEQNKMRKDFWDEFYKSITPAQQKDWTDISLARVKDPELAKEMWKDFWNGLAEDCKNKFREYHQLQGHTQADIAYKNDPVNIEKLKQYNDARRQKKLQQELPNKILQDQLGLLDEGINKMSNINIGDILPPNKDGAEKFATSDSVVPKFIKEAAYSADETRAQTIQRDWERLTMGLSDFVLAEQLTERELVGMGKPVPENYAEYFHTTLGEVKKNRKKAEQRLFNLIPQHSQLDSAAFFEAVHEQNEKEKEARERALELYPKTGVAKLDRSDTARKGLKKEAEAWCMKCGKVPAPGDKAHDGHEIVDLPADPDPKKEEEKRQQKMNPKKEASCSCTAENTCNECQMRVDASQDEAVYKEAASKWKAGTSLEAKHNGARAHVAYVNDDDKTYIIKVEGTMYPSYYSFDDAHDTFDVVKSKNPVEKEEGLS